MLTTVLKRTQAKRFIRPLLFPHAEPELLPLQKLAIFPLNFTLLSSFCFKFLFKLNLSQIRTSINILILCVSRNVVELSKDWLVRNPGWPVGFLEHK